MAEKAGRKKKKKPAAAKKPSANDSPAGRPAGDAQSTNDLRLRASEFRGQLNEKFIDARREVGSWKDEHRGEGIHLTLEALDTLWSQGELRNQAIPYDEEEVLEDVRYVMDTVDGEPLEKAFLPFSKLEEDVSSPETAALLLRAFAGARKHLRRANAWTRELRADFERATERASEFLIKSYRDASEGGGWGLLHESEPFLYVTATTARSLFEFESCELFKQSNKGEFDRQLTGASRFIRSCASGEGGAMSGRYYSTSGKNVHFPVYSAYALLGFLTLDRSDGIQVDFENEVRPALFYLRDQARDELDRLSAVATEDPRTAGSTRAYRDASGEWPWIQALACWLDRDPLVYDESWQSLLDILLLKLLEGDAPDAIYTWNRAAVALASYEEFSARRFEITDYELRKAIHRLFAVSETADSAYEYVRRQLRNE